VTWRLPGDHGDPPRVRADLPGFRLFLQARKARPAVDSPWPVRRSRITGLIPAVTVAGLGPPDDVEQRRQPTEATAITVALSSEML
jgi:hypothetical protein